MIKDYYAILGLDRDATDDDIKAVYRNAIKECHPDIAGDDPELVKRFQQLTEAYKVLIDPFRRKQHDNELPMKSYPLRRPTPAKVWKEVAEVVILRSDKIGPFQRALQDSVGLALAEDTLVVGFPHEEIRSAGYLEVPANRHAVLNALQLVMGKEMEFRAIRGTSLEDWERVQANEARVAAKAQETTQTTTASAQPSNLWEDLVFQMHRSFNDTPRRHLPQVRADFFCTALKWIRDVEEKARMLGAQDEATERALSKAIERLASLVELPTTYVAIELNRLKQGLL